MFSLAGVSGFGISRGSWWGDLTKNPILYGRFSKLGSLFNFGFFLRVPYYFGNLKGDPIL